LRLQNDKIRLNFIAGIFLMFLFASGAEAKRAEAPIQVKQGDIVRLVLEPGESASAVSGRFKKHSIPFFEAEKGLYVAILGIDMNLKAG